MRLVQMITLAVNLIRFQGFVTGAYEKNWWLGCVLQVESEDPPVTKHFTTLMLLEAVGYNYNMDEQLIQISDSFRWHTETFQC